MAPSYVYVPMYNMYVNLYLYTYTHIWRTVIWQECSLVFCINYIITIMFTCNFTMIGRRTNVSQHQLYLSLPTHFYPTNSQLTRHSSCQLASQTAVRTKSSESEQAVPVPACANPHPPFASRPSIPVHFCLFMAALCLWHSAVTATASFEHRCHSHRPSQALTRTLVICEFV